MSNKVYKNLQVNVGMPFQIYAPLNLHVNKPVNADEVNKQVKDENELNSYREEIISQAREEAELIIKEAMQQAEIIINKAEVESIEKCVSMQKAEQQGYEKGYREGKAQYEKLLQDAQNIKKQAIADYNNKMADVESDIINMVMDIAFKVIGSEVQINKENVLFLVRNAIEKCTNRENILLKVSEDDYEYICQNSEKLKSFIEDIGELEIRRDPSLSLGNCIVETPFGIVDASVDTKLKKIGEAFSRIIEK